MRRRIGHLLAVIAVLCLAIAMFGSTSASADRNGKVQLSVGGQAFTNHPRGALLDTARIAPGVRVSATLGVRSRFGVGTKLSLQLVHVHDDDNGCLPAEARVDTTCGPGQGELGKYLIVTIDEASSAQGQYRQIWQGSALELAKILLVGVTVPADSDRWLRVSGFVPASAGNIVESDTFSFGLHVVLAGNGVSGGSDVGGKHATHHHGSSSGHEGLAATGFSTLLFGVGGVLLLVAGVMLLSAGRAQRRATSASSSTERREPRPAAPR